MPKMEDLYEEAKVIDDALRSAQEDIARLRNSLGGIVVALAGGSPTQSIRTPKTMRAEVDTLGPTSDEHAAWSRLLKGMSKPVEIVISGGEVNILGPEPEELPKAEDLEVRLDDGSKFVFSITRSEYIPAPDEGLSGGGGGQTIGEPINMDKDAGEWINAGKPSTREVFVFYIGRRRHQITVDIQTQEEPQRPDPPVWFLRVLDRPEGEDDGQELVQPMWRFASGATMKAGHNFVIPEQVLVEMEDSLDIEVERPVYG